MTHSSLATGTSWTSDRSGRDGDERWAPVVGYEDEYLVSSVGRVWSVRRMRPDGHHVIGGRLLAGTPHPSGHILFRLTRGDRGRAFYAHHLVMAAFVGPMPEGLEVRHLNDIPDDNRVENLEYGTRAENMDDRVANGKHPGAAKSSCVRGHALRVPNLVACQMAKGFRACLACGRARASAKKHHGFDLQKTSDEKYRLIMEGAL